MEVIFEIRDSEEGGYHARALGHSIFTQAETWDELRASVLEATELHFEDSPESISAVALREGRIDSCPSRMKTPRGTVR
jgi:predicted RNase H-like HicB family nuclease